jgi:hypothetical protein
VKFPLINQPKILSNPYVGTASTDKPSVDPLLNIIALEGHFVISFIEYAWKYNLVNRINIIGAGISTGYGLDDRGVGV